MARCEVCGNEYAKSFEVLMEGEKGKHIFDSFECAIHALAPKCNHCDCRVIGHGVDVEGEVYCCGHCAEMSGVAGAHHRHT